MAAPLADPSPLQLTAGLVLGGRYRLERPLGEGGMSVVWVATQLALERTVALKVLSLTSEAQRSRLRREALALASVRHPNVVQAYDYGETPQGQPFLVLELLRGETLAERLAREGPLAAREAVSLLLPALDGLCAAHAAGLVHRDLKPENLFLSRGPEGEALKILDFGIARSSQPSQEKLTLQGATVGTPAYMAPEQLRAEPVDARADVWGAAVVLYELLAGESPFSTGELFATMRNVLELAPPYPRAARGMDGRLWRILMAALRKDSTERTPSVAKLREELAAWLAGAPSATPSRPEPPAAGSVHDRATLPQVPVPEAPTLGTIDELILRRLRNS